MKGSERERERERGLATAHVTQILLLTTVLAKEETLACSR